MGEGFPFFDILLFAMIAAFLILRLRSVLGKRTGHEKHPPEHLFARDAEAGKDEEEKVIHLPGPEAASHEEEDGEVPTVDEKRKTADKRIVGMIEISSVDPSFNPDAFLEGCAASFEMIIEAFASGDTSTLRSLLNDDVYADFTSAIKAREDAGETLDATLVGIKNMEILEADLDGKFAVITVKFVSDQINVIRDSEGEVTDGNQDYISEVTDIWTFARNPRSRDPNWTLTATRSSN